MFEADWIMKQLSLGINVISMYPQAITEDMKYHPTLSKLGLAPSSSFQPESEKATG